MSEQQTGAQILCEALIREGVEVMFGIPGGAIMPFYYAMVEYPELRHVLCRHEQGAGHAAEGYARATGKVGVCLGTSGPGATNLVTPICDAMMDSVPIVFLTGQVRTDLLGTDGFQEADTIGITMPIVKHSFMIQHPLEIPCAIHEAFYVARTGRPGPVIVDIPVDLSRADIPYEPVSDVHLPGYQPTTEGNAKQIRQAAKALAAARRPVIYAGGGVVAADAARELTELATADRFPVTCTLMGLGAFPAPHEQWLGMLGMHGTRAANYAMDEADLIVAIGARFDDRITGKLSEFAPRAKFIHIDIDPAEISKNVPAHIPIVGDAKNVLGRLVEEYRRLEPVGRPRDNGLRPPGRDGRGGGPAGPADDRPLRRRVDPDEHAGALHARDLRHPREGRDHEQRLPRHGPPMAGAVLGPALLPRGDEPVAGLCQTRRGDGLPRRAAGGQEH